MTQRARSAVERVRAGNHDVSSVATRRYRDPSFDGMTIKVLPGEHYVTGARDEMVVTVLGSCVSACIRDPRTGFGGMNHFMLPSSNDGCWGTSSSARRYGNFAMEHLINALLRQGAVRAALEVKIFGGADVLAGVTSVGDKNVEFVEEYLAAEGITVAARHLRGLNPRRVHYVPATGRVLMRELRRDMELESLALETTYQQRLRRETVCGGVELF